MNLREKMPMTAEFVDAMRAAFGADEIDGQIRKGMRGAATFWASENAIEIGTKAPSIAGVSLSDMERPAPRKD